jgi:LmbE family N-acetylglucosaminyl deacetylase
MCRFLVTLWLIIATAASAIAQTSLPPFTANDRVVIVAPHPDDEVLGTGGVIQQALAAGADVRVVYLTYGDHNQIAFKLYRHTLFLRARQYLAFGEQRHAEGTSATNLLGLPSDHLTFLGYPDWFTLEIWRDSWDPADLVRSDSTRATAVPYKDAFGYQHPYRAASIEADMVTLLRKFRPTIIFVPHPADSNRDHRAAANFLRLAALDVVADGLHPTIYYYLVHFGHWSRPYHYHPELELKPPTPLLDDGDWKTLPLTRDQTEKKYKAILLNRTETTIGQYFLVSLARANELFATIDVTTVPNLPLDLPLDWRKAVRNKAPVFARGEPAQKLGEHVSTTAAAAESIALEQTMFLQQGSDLIAQIELKNRLGKRTNVHLLLYGYKRGEDFAKLPKIKIDITPLGNVHVYNGDNRLSNHGITVTSVANRLFVRVPLQLLGGDAIDHVFTATRANFGEITPDDTAWRLFALSDGQASPAASLIFQSALPGSNFGNFDVAALLRSAEPESFRGREARLHQQPPFGQQHSPHKSTTTCL